MSFPPQGFVTRAAFEAHKARHQNGGADEISVAGLSGETAELTSHKDLDTGVHGAGASILATAADIVTHASNYVLHTKTVQKTADETVNNSTTLQNDDELLFAIGASEVWTGVFRLLFSGHGTPDIKFNLSAPSGATAYIKKSNAGAQAASTDQTEDAGAAAFQLFDFTVINSTTAGNVVLQWAQNVAHVSDTKVLTDSCLVATKVG